MPGAAGATLETLKTSGVLRKGEEAFHEGDACHSVFIICAGKVKLLTASSQGKVLLLRFAEPGEILGAAEAMLGGTPYQCSAIAAEPSIVAAIPRETFLRLAQSHPDVRVRVTVALSEQYKAAQRETHFLAFGDTSTARLARLLLEWSGGEAEGTGVRVAGRMTHSELAQSIGSTRETVTRILGDLNDRGIVERTPNGILIRSAQELTRLGTY